MCHVNITLVPQLFHHVSLKLYVEIQPILFFLSADFSAAVFVFGFHAAKTAATHPYFDSLAIIVVVLTIALATTTEEQPSVCCGLSATQLTRELFKEMQAFILQ